ncbi:MAG: MBL fold metallo-hydrolase [Chlorobi bacterium]|nr:MBL fold metallo-hydrolase [Chlorobiota bacterium]
MSLKITFLGTGGSQGIPVLGCDCRVCQSEDKYDKRLRTSAWIEVEGLSIIIDTGPDFRFQALNHGIHKVDYVLITHAHRDHVAGLDELRSYYFLQGKKPIPVYANQIAWESIRKQFYFIFENANYPGVLKVKENEIERYKPFILGNKVEVLPFVVYHYLLPVIGFRIGKMAYITDVTRIPPESMEYLKGLDLLVISALQKEPHIAHLTLEQAVEIAQQVNAKQTRIVHIGHKMGLHREVNRELPENIRLAYDGEVIEL